MTLYTTVQTVQLNVFLSIEKRQSSLLVSIETAVGKKYPLNLIAQGCLIK